MQWLKENGYETISLEQFRRFLSEGAPPGPAKPVIITFDDGTLGHYMHARSILQEVGFHGVFFVYPNVVSRAKGFVTWEELKTMIREGHSVQSHTMTHPLLNRLTKQEMDEEFRKAEEAFQVNLGLEVKWAAYPFGVYTVDTIRVLRERGYAGAFTVFPGGNTSRANPYTINRYMVSRRHSLSEFISFLTMKNLPLTMLNLDTGCRIRSGQEIQMKFDLPVQPQTIHVYGGQNFLQQNDPLLFRYDSGNRLLTVETGKKNGTYLFIQVNARSAEGINRQISLLYLRSWRVPLCQENQVP